MDNTTPPFAPKPAAQSLTIQAAVVVLAVNLFAIQYGLTVEETANLYALVDNAITALAALVVVYGRVRANQTIRGMF